MKWLRSVVGQIAGCGIFHRKCNIQSEATATVYFLTEYEGRTHFALLVRLFSYLFFTLLPQYFHIFSALRCTLVAISAMSSVRSFDTFPPVESSP